MTSSGGYYNDQESLHVTESCFPLKQLSYFTSSGYKGICGGKQVCYVLAGVFLIPYGPQQVESPGEVCRLWEAQASPLEILL